MRERRQTTIVRLFALLSMVLVIPLLTVRAEAESPLKFGVHQQVRAGETKQTALNRLEALAGRRMAAVRQFYEWDSAFPTAFENNLKGSGRTLVMSVKSRRTGGSVLQWSAIASAQPGSTLYTQMVSWARRIRTYGAPVYVTFNHEPEAPASRQMGNASQYVAAWRKWVTIFRQQGATNVKFMWIMTDQSFWLAPSDFRAASHWYPGDSWVDGIAGDAYNWYRCRPGINNAWKSLQQIIDPQRTFGLSHPNEELWLTEYGSTEDPADAARKAQWYRDARALFKTPTFSVFDGVIQFEPNWDFAACVWPPDSSAASATAWHDWAQDPFYGGPGG